MLIKEKLKKSRHIKKTYLPLLLAFIFVDESCDSFLLNLYGGQSNSLEFMLYIGFFLLAIIASPIQSGYSDFYCRKKSLIISLIFSMISVIFIILGTTSQIPLSLFLILAMLLKAGAGNTLPLSWAGIADTQTRDYRLSFGLSTAAIALGDFFFKISRKIFSESSYLWLMICIFLFLIIMCYKEFYDLRDNSNKIKVIKKQNSFKLIFIETKSMIKNLMMKRHIRKALLAFFLWEVSFYSALVVDLDMRIQHFNDLSISILVGYLIGIFFLKITTHKSDDQMIKIGYLFSLFSLIPIFIFKSLIEIRLLILFGYFLYSMAAVFLAPSLFSLLSKERGPQEQGKIYGIIDSTDLIAFLIASIAAILYNYLQLKSIYLVLFSFIVFAISWFPYATFKKTRPAQS